MRFSSIAVNTTCWTFYGDYFDTCVGDTTNAQMHALLTIKNQPINWYQIGRAKAFK